MSGEGSMLLWSGKWLFELGLADRGWEGVVDLAGDVAFQASDDLGFGEAFPRPRGGHAARPFACNDAAHRADGSTQRQQPARQAYGESDPTGDATPILTGLWHVGLVQPIPRNVVVVGRHRGGVTGEWPLVIQAVPRYAQALADLDVTALYTQQFG
jgi:hypothetical protein